MVECHSRELWIHEAKARAAMVGAMADYHKEVVTKELAPQAGLSGNRKQRRTALAKARRSSR